MKTIAAAVLVAASLAAGACGDSADTVTGPTDVTLTTEHFSGTIVVGGVRFYSFTVTQSGVATITLASVTGPTTGVALPVALRLGLGVPQATGCAVTAHVIAPAALVAQLTQPIEPGVHCIEVADAGELTAPVSFAARFTHP